MINQEREQKMSYLGITVGPILDTLSRTASPVGVWFASYFFSAITRDLCIELQENAYDIFSLPEGHVVKEHLHDTPGVGRYHDRIYASKEIDSLEIEAEVKRFIDNVLHLRAAELGHCKVDARTDEDIYRELSSYIQIHYIILEEKDISDRGIIMSLAEALSSLELSRDVSADARKLYMHQVMYGTKEEGSNVYLKNYPPLIDAAAANRDFLLAEAMINGLEIHNLEHLATLGAMNIDASDTKKVQRYFAVVQCDGDNMGYLLTDRVDLADPGAQKKRQQKVTGHCMGFSGSAIKDISEYGGYAIYAGGDDLLFFAPIIGKNGKTIWEFCSYLADMFSKSFEEFSEEGIDPSKAALSIGLSINYYKYPLYEAMADALGLLFDAAKKYTDGREDELIKNNIAARIRKAAGSSSAFVCWMNSSGLKETDNVPEPASPDIFREYIRLLNKYYLTGDAGEKDHVMHSLLYHMESMSGLFTATLDSDASAGPAPENSSYTERLFHNCFDNENQAFGKPMVADIAKFTAMVGKSWRDHLVKGIGSPGGRAVHDNELFAATSMLRTAKFLLEER